MRKMKDSGIEWIGEIPSDWRIVRIKNVSSLFGRIGFRGYTQQDLVNEDDGAITLSPSNMKNMRMNYEKCSYISWFKYNESPEIKVENGDILFVKTGSTYGKSAYVTELPKEATINPQLVVFKQSKMNKKLLAYVLQTSLISYQTELAVVGGTIPTMSQEKIKNFILPIPPIDEQKKIADFLDEKCGEIDSIRSDIQKQIDILNDYKKSVITGAVTKGLNPKAKLKDSGIEWIGKIPEGWVTRRLKELGKVRNGLTYSPTDICDPDEGYLVLRSSNIKDGKLSFEDNVFVSCRIPHELIVQKGDILICSRNGSRKLIGKNAIIDDVGNGRVTYGAFMMVFRTKYTKYLYYILNSGIFSYYLGSFFTSTINQLTGFDFGNMVVPFCTDGDEQKAIADYLDKKCSEIDATIADKQKQLETLDEYKKSLIFEYVTGKKEVPA